MNFNRNDNNIQKNEMKIKKILHYYQKGSILCVREHLSGNGRRKYNRKRRKSYFI